MLTISLRDFMRNGSKYLDDVPITLTRGDDKYVVDKLTPYKQVTVDKKTAKPAKLSTGVDKVMGFTADKKEVVIPIKSQSVAPPWKSRYPSLSKEDQLKNTPKGSGRPSPKTNEGN